MGRVVKLIGRLGGCAADCESIHAHRRLADTNWYALTVFAACSNARIERHIIADHTDPRQGIGAVTDQGRALNGRADAAAFD